MTTRIAAWERHYPWVDPAVQGYFKSRVPRLNELMTQLDADGHNTTQLRLELEGLVDEIGMKQFYS